MVEESKIARTPYCEGYIVYSYIRLINSSNEFHTPYLKAMFQYAQNHFSSDFYGYVNADILLDSTLIDSLKAIARDIHNGDIKNKVYIVGQRTNVQQEMQDRYTHNGAESPVEFVTRMLLKGHRYWDSAVVWYKK